MNRNNSEIELSSVEVHDKRYDPHTDSYLILAEFKSQPDNGKSWLVGWQPRAKSVLVDASFHQSGAAAHRRLLAVVKDKNFRSEHTLLEQDRQQQQCYRWEDDVVMPHSREISLEEAEVLISQVCEDYGVFPPELIWGEPGNRSEYIEEEAAIELHHHDNITLLHELAHHLHVENLDDAPHSHHGPGFVWLQIELYHRYAGLDLENLVASAYRRNLLGDLKTPSIALGYNSLREQFRNVAQELGRQKAANDNKIKLDKLDILADHKHSVSGARLIMGQRPENGQFVIAWVAPWQKTLTDFKIRKTPVGAENLFQRLKEREPPQSPSLIRDWQRALAYDWEDEHIGPGTAIVEEDKMKRIVKRIARDFNIAAPDISYKQPRSSEGMVSSWYDVEDNSIRMQHQDYYCLLHEMAHAIDVQINGNKWADHGPSFIRTLILLASRYNWEEPNKLEQSARDWGLAVAKKEDLPKLFSPKAP